MNGSPSSFAGLVGQTRPVAVLRNAIRRDRVAHAYLFHGPDGVGKSTAARLFSQALNCERILQHVLHCRGDGNAGDGVEAPRMAAKGGTASNGSSTHSIDAGEVEVCGVCRSCVLIANGNHPDVRVLAPERADQASVIPIEEIRKGLVYDVHLKPVSGRYKVYILDPADRTAPLAIHTVLKVLEEPPPHVVIVLVTARPASLPPTIPSRCQPVAFQLAGTAAIQTHLQQVGVDKPTAALLAMLSGGRPGWALQAAQQPQLLEARTRLLDLCAEMAGRPLGASLRIAEQIKEQAAHLASAVPAEEDDGDEDEQESPPDPDERAAPLPVRRLRAALPWCLEVMASWYRDRMAAGSGGALFNEDYAEALTRKAGAGDAEQAGGAIEAILSTRHRITRNANIDLALEALAVRLVGGSS